MNIENPMGRLSKKEARENEEAHDLANMMKVELGAIPAYEKYLKPTTAEEYDKALEVVEEIKRMAEEEPLTQKVLYEIARLAVKSSYGVAEVLAALPESNPNLKYGETMLWKIDNNKTELLKKLEDATMKLRKL
ncbi:MAG: hypothetical protein NTZ97_04220, partial [Candidatus Moranbacteria bacterium]|nr:hypothetical protein [Candidatus Moranbacteria bacterium]